MFERRARIDRISSTHERFVVQGNLMQVPRCQGKHFCQLRLCTLLCVIFLGSWATQLFVASRRQRTGHRALCRAGTRALTCNIMHAHEVTYREASVLVLEQVQARIPAVAWLTRTILQGVCTGLHCPIWIGQAWRYTLPLWRAWDSVRLGVDGDVMPEFGAHLWVCCSRVSRENANQTLWWLNMVVKTVPG